MAASFLIFSVASLLVITFTAFPSSMMFVCVVPENSSVVVGMLRLDSFSSSTQNTHRYLFRQHGGSKTKQIHGYFRYVEIAHTLKDIIIIVNTDTLYSFIQFVLSTTDKTSVG